MFTQAIIKKLGKTFIAIFLIALSISTAYSEDRYYQISYADIKTAIASIPELQAGWSKGIAEFRFEEGMKNKYWSGYYLPYGSVEGDGEVYFAAHNEVNHELNHFVVRVPNADRVRVWLFIPTDGTKFPERYMIPVPIEVSPESTLSSSEQKFLTGKLAHYRLLLKLDLVGGEYYRYQYLQTQVALPQQSRIEIPPETSSNPVFDALDIFSGTQAIRENLQLDQALRGPRGELLKPGRLDLTIPLRDISGVSTKGYDWQGLLKDAKPTPDVLAAYIPADQPGIFFNSLAAMLSLLDESEKLGAPVWRFVEPRPEDIRIRERYERQLCLDTRLLGRELAPEVVKSVAFTASDPYLRSGTDAAILFETTSPKALIELIAVKQLEALRSNLHAESVNGEIEGVKYTGVRTPDRTVCSYRAVIENVVIVSNSLVQLRWTVLSGKEKVSALKSSPEYLFFRNRYPIDKQFALAVLTDATIRRWCGPQWRIADSRRNLAATMLAALNSQYAAELVVSNDDVKELKGAPEVLGTLELGAGTIRSSIFNSLAFQTPISELNTTMATPKEVEAYSRWRVNYERNFARFFDPIAIQFGIKENNLAFDTTVMPLKGVTEYRSLLSLVQGAKCTAGVNAIDSKELLRFGFAFNLKNPEMRFINEIASSLTGIQNCLKWVGSSISFHVSNDGIWKDLLNNNFQGNPLRLELPPIAMRIEVVGLAALEKFLPEFYSWVDKNGFTNRKKIEESKYKGVEYKVISVSEGNIYCFVINNSLILATNESFLKRIVDHELERMAGPPNLEPALEDPLGDQFWMSIRVKEAAEAFLPIAMKSQLTRYRIDLDEDYQFSQQHQAWANIPILNEWKRRFPNSDPIAVHERILGVRLSCPAGGNYVWNERWRTIESTVFGHPGEPKLCSSTIPMLFRNSSLARFGLTFENDGVRAKFNMDRTAPPKELPKEHSIPQPTRRWNFPRPEPRVTPEGF